MKFKFIDLFAGIGGFHIAMHRLGGECVFASENDPSARQTYIQNFKEISPNLFANDMFNCDIRTVMPSDIPDFDILCAGFPCQPFSQAGYKRGFNDNHNSERGNLFFNIVDILKEKKPKAFFLENVRGIVKHDNGNTFKTIRNIIENELNYSFYYKIVSASDYGLPQLRPRTFMVGFRDEGIMGGFSFPVAIPLKFNMSDVWGGNCSRDIGFTLRVGGKGSHITDRRNWDSYLVDGVVKKISPAEARKMQGFPENFSFPVSNSQAMKQLGNSVAIDAVQIVAQNIITHMEKVMDNPKKDITLNKGEWAELLVFIKIIVEQNIHLADANLNSTDYSFEIKQVTTHNLDYNYFLLDKSKIEIVHKQTKQRQIIPLNAIINQEIIKKVTDKIIAGTSTFTIDELEGIKERLKLNKTKGGNSDQKSDIILSIKSSDVTKEEEGFGIKSFLGNPPTLLNASSNTNFIFQIDNASMDLLEKVNSIDSKSKVSDRISLILNNGCTFSFIGAEKDSMDYNLKMIDSKMPSIIEYLLLSFYKDRVLLIKDAVDKIDSAGILKCKINYPDKPFLESKIKNLLVGILLGFFAGTKWSGDYESKGTIIMKKNGEYVGFHIIELDVLKNYLYTNIKMDTPSTTRHRFGTLYQENGKFYFKLNLQLRFIDSHC